VQLVFNDPEPDAVGRLFRVSHNRMPAIDPLTQIFPGWTGWLSLSKAGICNLAPHNKRRTEDEVTKADRPLPRAGPSNRIHRSRVRSII
jgi:hypothetical protein